MVYLFTVKDYLQACAAFVIIGILASFVAMVFFCPLWHYWFYVAGSILAFASG